MRIGRNDVRPMNPFASLLLVQCETDENVLPFTHRLRLDNRAHTKDDGRTMKIFHHFHIGNGILINDDKGK